VFDVWLKHLTRNQALLFFTICAAANLYLVHQLNASSMLHYHHLASFLLLLFTTSYLFKALIYIVYAFLAHKDSSSFFNVI